MLDQSENESTSSSLLLILPLNITYVDVLPNQPKSKLVVFFDSSIVNLPIEIENINHHDSIDVTLTGYKPKSSLPCPITDADDTKLMLPDDFKICFQCFKQVKNEFDAPCWIDYGYGNCNLKDLLKNNALNGDGYLTVDLQMHTAPECFTLEKIQVKINNLNTNVLNMPKDVSNALCEHKTSQTDVKKRCIVGEPISNGSRWSDSDVMFYNVSIDDVSSINYAMEQHKIAMKKTIATHLCQSSDPYLLADDEAYALMSPKANDNDEYDDEKKHDMNRKVEEMKLYNLEYETETRCFENNSEFAKNINCPYYPSQLTVDDSKRCFLPYAAYACHETPCISTAYWFNALKIITHRRCFKTLASFSDSVFKCSLNHMSEENLTTACSLSMEMICQYVWLMEYIPDSTVNPKTGKKINIELFGCALRSYSGDCDDLTLAILQMFDNFTAHSFDLYACLNSEAVRTVFAQSCDNDKDTIDGEIKSAVHCLLKMQTILRNYIPIVCIEGVTTSHAQNLQNLEKTDDITGAHAAIKCLPEYYFRQCISRCQPNHPLGINGPPIPHSYQPPSKDQDRCGHCETIHDKDVNISAGKASCEPKLKCRAYINCQHCGGGGGSGKKKASDWSFTSMPDKCSANGPVSKEENVSYEPWQKRVPIVIGEGTGELNCGGEIDPCSTKNRGLVYRCKALESTKKPLYTNLKKSPFYKMILFGSCNRFLKGFRTGTFRFCTKETSFDGSQEVYKRGVSFEDLINKRDNVYIIPYGWEFVNVIKDELDRASKMYETKPGQPCGGITLDQRCKLIATMENLKKTMLDHTVNMKGYEPFACEYSQAMEQLMIYTLRLRTPAKLIRMPWELTNDNVSCYGLDQKQHYKPIYKSWDAMPSKELQYSAKILQNARHQMNKTVQNDSSSWSGNANGNEFACFEKYDNMLRKNDHCKPVDHYNPIREYETTHGDDYRRVFDTKCTMKCGYYGRYRSKCTRKPKDYVCRKPRYEKPCRREEEHRATYNVKIEPKIDRVSVHWGNCFINHETMAKVVACFETYPNFLHFDYELEVHSSLQFIWVLNFYFSK